MDELDVLEPTGMTVSFRGERLEVRPLTLDKLAGIVRAARPLLTALVALEDKVADADDNVALDCLLTLLEEHSEGAAAVVAIAVGRERADIAAGELPEFMQLAQAVIEVNRDFFGRLLVSLQGGRAVRRASGAGLTRSNSSSSAAID
ncbi:hypothetical protein ACHZ97_04280 [Lysobacter soli]|uniref:hypothetical protein n=1 Tax=Lysobacter soli TaxID=453783 RepID=UPI0037CC24F0